MCIDYESATVWHRHEQYGYVQVLVFRVKVAGYFVFASEIPRGFSNIAKRLGSLREMLGTDHPSVFISSIPFRCLKVKKLTLKQLTKTYRSASGWVAKGEEKVPSPTTCPREKNPRGKRV